MLQTRSSILLVAQVNTQAGGSAVVITNSSQLFITNTNLTVVVQNSGGLFAQQSGAWAVSSTILNSAGWVVNVANTGGAVNILNSGGLFAMQSGTWTVTQASTGRTSIILNSGGLYAMQSGAWSVSSTILNSAGWVVNVANTANRTVIVNNSGGLFANQSGTWTVGVSNSAGWVMAQSNTAGMTVNVINSAGWVVGVSNTAGTLARTYDTNIVYDGLTSTTVQYKNIVIGGSGNTLLVNAVSGKRIRLLSMMIMANGTGTIYIQNDSTSATNLIGPLFLAANVGFVLPLNQNGWCQTGTNILLNLSSSTINSIGGCLTYIQTS